MMLNTFQKRRIRYRYNDISISGFYFIIILSCRFCRSHFFVIVEFSIILTILLLFLFYEKGRILFFKKCDGY